MQFPYKSINNVHILSDDSPELAFGKRNLKDTNANVKNRNRGPRQRLEMQQKKLKEAQGKEKNETLERMKQEPAENGPDNSGSKNLKDSHLAQRPKKELVQIFNTLSGYAPAYDGCFPRPKQFYFADKKK